MAHKKGGGSSTNGRDSHGQRLGVKRFGGMQLAECGNDFGAAARDEASGWRECWAGQGRYTLYAMGDGVRDVCGPGPAWAVLST